MVVYAIGTHANPIIGQTSKLKLNGRGYIETDETLAMGAGRRAARTMKAYLGIRDTDTVYHPEGVGPEGKLFGIDIEERNFARLYLA